MFEELKGFGGGWLVGKAEDGEAMAIERKLEAGQDDATQCHAYRRPKLLASTASDKAAGCVTMMQRGYKYKERKKGESKWEKRERKWGKREKCCNCKNTKSERINGILKSRMDLRKRGRIETVDWFLAISSSRYLVLLVFLAGDKVTRWL
jgi:hypothetical protein